MKPLAVFITAPSAASARKLADGLLVRKLAACVTVLPGAASRYWWKGRLESARELLLVAKTSRARLPALVKAVKALHPYEVPEVVALPIAGGNPDYLAWLGTSLK